MIGVSEFCKQPFLHTESVRTSVSNFGSVYSFNLRNYLLRLHVHPYFIKYHSSVYLTLCK